VHGPRVKTDRLDSQKIARYYRSGLLTVVHIPSFDEETIRDIVRTRHFLSKELRSVKGHILSLCRRMGLDYRAHRGLKACNFWTERHLNWLQSELGIIKDPALSFNCESLLVHLKHLERQLATYEVEINRIAEGPRFTKKTTALKCYRGIDTLTAMTIAVEIGDPNRFPHPRALTSYAGMDVAEYSSGANGKPPP